MDKLHPSRATESASVVVVAVAVVVIVIVAVVVLVTGVKTLVDGTDRLRGLKGGKSP